MFASAQTGSVSAMGDARLAAVELHTDTVRSETTTLLVAYLVVQSPCTQELRWWLRIIEWCRQHYVCRSTSQSEKLWCWLIIARTSCSLFTAELAARFTFHSSAQHYAYTVTTAGRHCKRDFSIIRNYACSFSRPTRAYGRRAKSNGSKVVYL